MFEAAIQLPDSIRHAVLTLQAAHRRHSCGPQTSPAMHCSS